MTNKTKIIKEMNSEFQLGFIAGESKRNEEIKQIARKEFIKEIEKKLLSLKLIADCGEYTQKQINKIIKELEKKE